MAASSKHVPIPRRGVDYRGKVVLAPMVRSGELPSRLLALDYGADLAWGPETVDRAIIGTTKRFNQDSQTIEWFRKSSNGKKQAPEDAKESCIFRVHPEREAGKLVFQIGTADPDLAVQAAHLVAEHVAGIDVNAGCPKPFSTSGGMGAALLRTPDKLCAILEALVQNIMPEHEIGISVKIRVLNDPADTEALVRRLCATGITGLTVHCRTPEMRAREPAIREQLRMVVDICHEFGVACLMNGDVQGRDKGLELAAEFGADGAMIATAAEKNPSCFRGQSGQLPWLDVVRHYVKTCMDVDNRFGNTKYLLGQMVPGKDKRYQQMTQGKSYSHVCQALGFDDLIQQAQDTDARLGIDKPPVKAGQKAKAKAKTSALAAGGQMGAAQRQAQQRRPLAKRTAGAQPLAKKDSVPQRQPDGAMTPMPDSAI